MTKQNQVAVVGAGVLGLIQALLLQRTGHQVTLFERENERLDHHCSSVAAGMIAPFCELNEAEPEAASWGAQALAVWQSILSTLKAPVHSSFEGTLVIAHHQDRTGLQHLAERVKHLGFEHSMRVLSRQTLRDLEPELEGRFAEGLFFSPEGEVDPRMLLPALVQTLRSEGAILRFQTPVEEIQDGKLRVHAEWQEFEWVLDCRGLAARDIFPHIRGVRGEVMLLRAPDVQLRRPIRMVHPRYPLYIVPRPDHHFFIGATAVESESMRKTTVKSALEMLSAAYSLHPAFAEAEIIETRVHLRPTLPEHLPAIRQQGHTLHLNGLTRHGYLLAPYLAKTATHFVQHQTWPEDAHRLHRPQASA